jgi:NAD(P)-dependent dehydrogenase (short-subunit alcohol dehydrogenase family)
MTDNTGGNACYRISKAALNQLTRNIAVDLKKQGSNVLALAVHPGWLATKMTGFYGEDDWETSIAGIVDTVERFGTDEGKDIENGGYVKWDGTRMDY